MGQQLGTSRSGSHWPPQTESPRQPISRYARKLAHAPAGVRMREGRNRTLISELTGLISYGAYAPQAFGS